METNRQRCERLGMMDYDTLLDISQESRCKMCDKFCEKNLSPTNPACEGEWCDEALGYWLDEESDEEEKENA
ncbi:MAG: hypothetical protein RR588_03385 [Solibacillus sp.]